MKKTTSWGKVSKWYNSYLEGGKETYQSAVILPNLLRILNIKKGDKIIDIACGQGFFSRAFFEAGADVTGIDISNKLITIAKKNSPKDIKFYRATSEKMPMLKDKSFDKAVIILSIQNIENIEKTFKEIYRILKNDGSVHIVMSHPCFRVLKRSSWGMDSNGKQYRRIDGYLSQSKEKIQMHPGDAPDIHTLSFNRPLQVYFKALRGAGFAIISLEEWISHKKSQPGPRAKEEDRIRKEFPMFLYLEGIKQRK